MSLIKHIPGFTLESDESESLGILALKFVVLEISYLIMVKPVWKSFL